MKTRLTDEEWGKLSPQNFDTRLLLLAIAVFDELRDEINHGQYTGPPQLQTELVKLHRLATAVIDHGSRSQVTDLFELASQLDQQVSYLVIKLQEIQDALSRLTALYPDSLCFRKSGGRT
jgi:hypothetical protein